MANNIAMSKTLSFNTKNYAMNNLSMINVNSNPNLSTDLTNNFFVYSPSVYSDDSFEEIGHILDKFCEYMILPVQEKLQPFISENLFNEKKNQIEQAIILIKSLFQKEEEYFIKTSTSSEKQDLSQSKEIKTHSKF